MSIDIISKIQTGTLPDTNATQLFLMDVEKFLDALYAIAAAHKKLGNYQTALNYLVLVRVLVFCLAGARRRCSSNCAR